MRLVDSLNLVICRQIHHIPRLVGGTERNLYLLPRTPMRHEAARCGTVCTGSPWDTQSSPNFVALHVVLTCAIDREVRRPEIVRRDTRVVGTFTNHRLILESTSSIKSIPVVASSTCASVTAWATTVPVSSTPRGSFLQPWMPFRPCLAAAHFAVRMDSGSLADFAHGPVVFEYSVDATRALLSCLLVAQRGLLIASSAGVKECSRITGPEFEVKPGCFPVSRDLFSGY